MRLASATMNSLRLLVCSVLLVTGVLAIPARLSEAKSGFDLAKEVTFHLYTQSNHTEVEFLKFDDDSSGPSFNPNNPTRFIIHGAHSTWQSISRGRDAYLATGEEYNIVLVDWSGIAAWEIEEIGRDNSIFVGEYIGNFITHMIEARGLNPDTLIVMGHSMGGHVAAIASNRAGGDQVIPELVALDPASDIYDDQLLENQLDKTDAKFVQVIHTDGGGLGILDSGRGHADFLPNGGSIQPGCGPVGAICHHGRVLDLYWESIASRAFVAAKCASYEDYVAGACSANEHILMGEWSPLTASGTYYLNTDSQAPYALGDTGL